MTARVVVVEQSAAIARSIAEVLTDCGLLVCAIAHDGLSGLDAIKQHAPDVVTFDLLLPRLGGLPLVDAARRAGSSARYVAITAVSSRERVAAARDAGVSYYILKPIDWDKLRTVAAALVPAEVIHASHTG
ncbi:MAG: response regulator [Deltaproteobacteria bacterium]|nr:MAG: response regulator [Deltaproteobacteria bacterium]